VHRNSATASLMCGTPSEESHGSLTSHACERADGCHGGPGAAESLWNPGGLRFGRAYALRVRFLLTFSAGYLSILSKQTTTLSCVPGGCEHIHELGITLSFLDFHYHRDGKDHKHVSLVSTVKHDHCNEKPEKPAQQRLESYS
jgi:hypothetical protein